MPRITSKLGKVALIYRRDVPNVCLFLERCQSVNSWIKPYTYVIASGSFVLMDHYIHILHVYLLIIILTLNLGILYS